MKKLEEYVRSIPDFPQEGIIFRDVTSVLEDADGMHLAVDTMQDLVKDLEFDVVVGAESRGFIFGAPIAYNLHKPFALIRKKGKLPCETVSQEYSLEYGTAVIEMHKTSIKPGQKVLIVDDLIATGGTTQAMISLVERLGGEVAGVLVLIELAGLKGREAIAGYRLDSAVTNLNNTTTNLSEAQSRIQDADYATEVSNMSKAQIIQQAGNSVLAKANQVPQQVLSLLQG